jgi:hypothetical protein
MRFFGKGTRTHSLIFTYDDRRVRFVDTLHLYMRDDIKAVFY